MRERTTWNRDVVVKKAALLKTADPYTMNQDHPQPAADKYVTGDPSTFAEDVHTPNTWESEYSGDAVKRDAIGMPEFRSDTFNHSEKTAKEVLLKKADLCVAVARIMLAGTKTASERSIENQAFSLMFMPDQALISTHKRLAGEQDAEDQDDDAEDEGQDKQAQDQDDDDDEGQDKQAQDQDQDDDDGQEKTAAMQRLAFKVASSLRSGNYRRAQDQIQQLVQQQAQGQGQQQVSQQQIQQMIQEAMQQQQQQQGQQGQPQQQQGQGQQDPMQQGQQQIMQNDEQALDQMLAQDGCGPMAESDIQMETAPMDVGMDDLGPEDEALRTLFAQDDEQEGQGQTQQKQKQANVRTASTRTVGTRPTAGVAKLGGGSQGGASIADLSSLWQSAPDVRDAFGLK